MFEDIIKEEKNIPDFNKDHRATSMINFFKSIAWSEFLKGCTYDELLNEVDGVVTYLKTGKGS